jgi:hypothetical protein
MIAPIQNIQNFAVAPTVVVIRQGCFPISRAEKSWFGILFQFLGVVDGARKELIVFRFP